MRMFLQAAVIWSRRVALLAPKRVLNFYANLFHSKEEYRQQKGGEWCHPVHLVNDGERRHAAEEHDDKLDHLCVRKGHRHKH